jgi:hypothetical protein
LREIELSLAEGLADIPEALNPLLLKHARNGMLSPVEFERQQKMKTEGV